MKHTGNIIFMHDFILLATIPCTLFVYISCIQGVFNMLFKNYEVYLKHPYLVTIAISFLQTYAKKTRWHLLVCDIMTFYHILIFIKIKQTLS